jgi:uncharacterized protein (TIGR00255 family)
MTGFGRGVASVDGIVVQVEISTVNRKALDIQLNLPAELNEQEAAVRNRIAALVHRGRVNIRIQIDADKPTGLRFQAQQAENLLSEINAFASDKGLGHLTEVTDLLNLPGVFEETQTPVQPEVLAAALMESLDAALQNLNVMRENEGRVLQDLLSRQLDALQALADQITPWVEKSRDAKVQSLRAAVAEVGELDDDLKLRVQQEIALYGEKTDVREEVDRIHAHLAHAREKVQDRVPVGRALDFICQELNREFNTLGVKAAHAELNQLALDGKEKTEQLREQVQNVE